MSVVILRWAMDQAESADPGQRARWGKYMLVRALHDQLSVAVAPTTIVLEDDEEEEMVGAAVEPEDAGNAEVVEMVVRASEPGVRTLPMEVDNYKPQGYRRSKRLQARRG